MVKLHWILYLLQGEGVSYRGRVLIELSTQLEGKADKMVDDISSDDILVSQVQRPDCVTLLSPRSTRLLGLNCTCQHYALCLNGLPVT